MSLENTKITTGPVKLDKTALQQEGLLLVAPSSSSSETWHSPHFSCECLYMQFWKRESVWVQNTAKWPKKQCKNVLQTDHDCWQRQTFSCQKVTHLQNVNEKSHVFLLVRMYQKPKNKGKNQKLQHRKALSCGNRNTKHHRETLFLVASAASQPRSLSHVLRFLFISYQLWRSSSLFFLALPSTFELKAIYNKRSQTLRCADLFGETSWQ